MKLALSKTLLRSSSLLKIPNRTKFLIFQETCEKELGGKGVFACQNIPKGAVVWAFDNVNCERLTELSVDVEDEEKLSTQLQKGFLNKRLDKFIVLDDGAQYTNHAKEANLRWGSDDETWVAARNIKDGEEITFDHSQFGLNSDCGWLKSLFAKLHPSVLEVESKLKADRTA
eukprot:GFUD01040188.1.p1 GENE.GFUD01040188.1~~GFUD01040188.1.p1  ORF type:complete len:172 (+),score=47.04 GFUD01040188.1:102-617(+)